MRILAIIMCVTLLTGCSTSLNTQNSIIRGSADLGTTLLLVNTSIPQAQVQRAAEDIQAFLKSGKISELTRVQLVLRLRNTVPQSYWTVVDTIVSKVQGAPTEKLGVKNLKRMNAACVGIISGAKEFSSEDR